MTKYFRRLWQFQILYTIVWQYDLYTGIWILLICPISLDKFSCICGNVYHFAKCFTCWDLYWLIFCFQVGSSISVDVLKYNSSNRRAFIRCPSDYFIKLHCALTLTGTFEGQVCAYRFHNFSPTLISLASNSRAYKHL